MAKRSGQSVTIGIKPIAGLMTRYCAYMGAVYSPLLPGVVATYWLHAIIDVTGMWALTNVNPFVGSVGVHLLTPFLAVY